MKRLALLMTAVGVIAFCAGGCDSSQKQELRYFREQNQELTQRVAELEEQLEQAEAIMSAAAADVQIVAAKSMYTVVKGDTIWSIAKKRLGSGDRYEEILALNRQITNDKPLAIGTKLKMPSNR